MMRVETLSSVSRIFCRSTPDITANPGRLPTSMLPFISAIPRALAPFSVAHIRASVREISSNNWMFFTMDMWRVEASESVPMAIVEPMSLSIFTGGLMLDI